MMISFQTQMPLLPGPDLLTKGLFFLSREPVNPPYRRLPSQFGNPTAGADRDDLGRFEGSGRRCRQVWATSGTTTAGVVAGAWRIRGPDARGNGRASKAFRKTRSFFGTLLQ